jgi:adenylate cyclase
MRHSPESKLAAIMFADVEGYTGSMEADQVQTVKAVSGHFRRVVYPCVARHLGRVLKTMGDGYLAEFDGAVSAVLCAIDIQQAVAKRNARLRRLPRLQFRIGVHVGEILVVDNDVFGQEVNLAARLQSAAEAGSICISQDAYRQVSDQCPCAIEDLGERLFKNLSRPIRVYAIRPNTESAPMPPHATGRFASTRAFFGHAGIPTIALPPFGTLTADVDGRLIAEAVHIDIATELARTRNLILISEATARQLAADDAHSRNLAAELGVQYLLRGAVVAADSGPRLALHLAETASDALIWAENFPAEPDEATATRANITQRVASLIEGRVLKHRLSATRAVPVPGLKAFDHWLQGQVLAEQWEPASDDKALASFVEAVRLDPDFARGHASIAAILNTRNNLRPGSPTRLADQRRAMASVRRALELDPDDGRNHLDMAWSAMLQRDYDTAELHFGTAQSHSPYDANVAISAGQGFAYLGQHELGISLARKAFWLSPVHPPYYSTYLATIYFVARRYEECLATALKVADLFPEIPAWQAAAAAQLGRMGEARRFAADFRRAVRRRWASRGACDDRAMIDWLSQIIMLREEDDADRLRHGLARAGIGAAQGTRAPAPEPQPETRWPA